MKIAVLIALEKTSIMNTQQLIHIIEELISLESVKVIVLLVVKQRYWVIR